MWLPALAAAVVLLRFVVGENAVCCHPEATQFAVQPRNIGRDYGEEIGFNLGE